MIFQVKSDWTFMCDWHVRLLGIVIWWWVWFANHVINTMLLVLGVNVSCAYYGYVFNNFLWVNIFFVLLFIIQWQWHTLYHLHVWRRWCVSFHNFVFSVSKNELGNASHISFSQHVTKSSISIPRLCRRPVGMCSSRCRSLFGSSRQPLQENGVYSTPTQHPTAPVALPTTTVNIEQCLSRSRHELSLNFDCTHYQNAATEILLAETEA